LFFLRERPTFAYRVAWSSKRKLKKENLFGMEQSPDFPNMTDYCQVRQAKPDRYSSVKFVCPYDSTECPFRRMETCEKKTIETKLGGKDGLEK
jgi:hypothetical protein